MATLLPRQSLTRRAPRASAVNSGNPLKNQSGQIILEYILLLFISVTVAVALTRQLTGRNRDSAGVVTRAWGQMNDAIGQDIIK